MAVSIAGFTLMNIERENGSAGTTELECSSPRWMDTTNELDESVPSPWHTEEEALIAEWDTLPGSLPPQASAITRDPSGDGFLETARSDDRAEYVLLRNGAVVAQVGVVPVDAGGYVVAGVTMCDD